MNTSAKAILWLGMFLIAMLVVSNWKTIAQTIFGP